MAPALETLPPPPVPAAVGRNGERPRLVRGGLSVRLSALPLRPVCPRRGLGERDLDLEYIGERDRSRLCPAVAKAGEKLLGPLLKLLGLPARPKVGVGIAEGALNPPGFFMKAAGSMERTAAAMGEGAIGGGSGVAKVTGK